MNWLRSIVAGVALSILTAGAAFAQCGTTAPANRFCGNDTGSSALATWKTVPTGALTPIAGGTVLGNRGTTAAVPSPLTNPILGIPGTSTGELGLAGATSGTATLRAQAAAGTAVSLLPTAAGTLVGTSVSPLAINATTGEMSITGLSGGVLAGSPPAFTRTPTLGASGTVGSLAFGNATSGLVTVQTVAGALGTVTVSLPAASGTVAVSASAPLALNATTGALSITGLAGGVLAGSGPAFTITPVLGVPTASQGTLGFAGATSGTATITAQATAGTPTLTLPNTSGTFAVNATTPLVLSATTGGLTCPTCVTSSGGGAISGTAPISVSGAGVVSINAPYTTLTASNGGIVYSGTTNLAILAGTATAGQMLRSGASTTPAWSTATWPATAAAGTMLAAGTSNVISATATPTLGTNGGTGGAITLAGSTSGTGILRVAAAAGAGIVFQLPSTTGSSGNLLSTDGAGVTSWIPAGGTGTVTSVTAGAGLNAAANPITTTGTISSYFDPGSITNCILVVTFPGNALTLELKTQSGATPSASAPCTIGFGSATLATGDYTPVNVTAATTFALGGTGSTLGVAANVPFRVWVTAWNNAGTVVLGVSNQTGTLDVYPLDETNLQSSTACSGCTGATSAGVFYTTAAQTNKAIRILGFLEWSAGLATPGTWGTANSSMRLMGPGVKKPGDIVRQTFMSSTSPTNTATPSVVASSVAKNFTKTSAANPVRLNMVGYGLNNSGSTGGLTARFYRGSAACTTAIGILGYGTILSNNTGNNTLQWVDVPAAGGTTAANYTVCISSPNSLSMDFPYASSGGVLSLEEIMG